MIQVWSVTLPSQTFTCWGGDQYSRTVVCVAVDFPFAAPWRSRKWVLGFLSQRSRFLLSKSLSIGYCLVLFFSYSTIWLFPFLQRMLVICTFIHYCPKTKKNLLISSQFPFKPSAWKLSVSQSRKQLLRLSVSTRVQLHCMLKMETRLEEEGRDMWRYLSALRLLASAQDSLCPCHHSLPLVTYTLFPNKTSASCWMLIFSSATRPSCLWSMIFTSVLCPIFPQRL